ncbi:MAG: hypothetical protein RLZZ282_1560 [Verrucomicrobiota bacterium]
MKRFILWTALLGTATLTLLWPAIPIPNAQARIASIPCSSSDFKSSPIKLSDADREQLGKAHAIQRLIETRNGDRLILTVIDGSDNRHAVHDPSYCFAGANWKLLTKTTVKVPSGDATWLALSHDDKTTHVLWFFDDGKHQFSSPFHYWLATSLRRATLGRSGDEPILVSLRSFPDAKVNWDRIRQILLPALGFL